MAVFKPGMKLRGNNERRFSRARQRMAGENLPAGFEQLRDQLFIPYGDRSLQDGNAGYVGRTQQEWYQENREVQRDLEREGSFWNMKERLLELGWDEREAHSTASEAANQFQRTGRVGTLRAERMGVPNAAADEAISRAALEGSGFTNVAPGTHMGTDIVATLGDKELLIDAQTRLGASGNYSMGVLAGSNRSIDDLVGIYEAPENQSKKLKQLIKELRVGDSRLRGDKLLHEPEVYEELFGQQLDAGKYKDGIITTNRGNYQHRRDNPLGIYPHGPYNPVRPRGIDLMDLNATRNLLLNEEIGTLRGMGINPATRTQDRDGGALRLLLSQKLVQQLGGSLGKLNPEVVQALSVRQL